MQTAAQPEAAAPSATAIYLRIWAEKFASLAAAEKAATDARRAEAFVDAPRLVAGCLIRPLTGYDLLMLEGYEHPIVAAGELAAAMTPKQLAGFLWYQRSDKAPLWFPSRACERFTRRLEKLWCDAKGAPNSHYLFAVLPEALAFIEASFADAAVPALVDEKTGLPVAPREPGTAFLAPLVITVAAETGWTEEHIMRLPLARLWQYLKIIRRRHESGPSVEHSVVARYRSLCLAETNAELRRLAGS